MDPDRIRRIARDFKYYALIRVSLAQAWTCLFWALVCLWQAEWFGVLFSLIYSGLGLLEYWFWQWRERTVRGGGA